MPEIAFYQNSGTYLHLFQARLNTYLIFTELALRLSAEYGFCGLVVPSGIATDSTSQRLFTHIVESGRLRSLFDFENRLGLFPGVHRSYKFCLLTLTGLMHASAVAPEFVFFAQQTSDVKASSRRFTLTQRDLQVLSPITGLCPTFRNRRDKEMVLGIYGRIDPLITQQESVRGWLGSDFLIVFRSDSSSHLYKSPTDFAAHYPSSLSDQHFDAQGLEFLPVWEAKLIHQFDHRYATYEGVSSVDRMRGRAREVQPHEKELTWSSQPRNWVEKEEILRILANRAWSSGWLMGYRDITNATNERTAIASALPIGGASQPLNLFLPASAWLGALWLAGMNSFVLDYVVRQLIGGVHLNITTCRQLPVISAVERSDLGHLILNCVCELVYTSPSLTSFARECGYHGSPFRWDEDRRFLLRCELDAAYFHLYGIGRDDADYIMETFPIVKRRDVAAHGEYRTKRVILEIYDAMQQAMDSGQPYQTRLDPPPADPSVAHFIDQ